MAKNGNIRALFSIYAILLAVSRRFLQEGKAKKNRCLLHIKTAVRDQTSAVFAFFVFASSPFEDNDNIYMSTATRNMHV